MGPDQQPARISPSASAPIRPSPYYGAYGYYFIRGSFTSDYGSVWDSSSNNLSVYLQDSWTIKNRLTLNLGLRAESQYMPAFTDEPTWPGYQPKPITFDLGQSLAPRLGVVYDVFGDSSLKVFGSFGIYYDIMKLYLGQLTFGGSKRVEDYLRPPGPGLDDRSPRTACSTTPPTRKPAIPTPGPWITCRRRSTGSIRT